jgi:hypothetical protein
MGLDEDLAKTNELLKEARRLLLQDKAQECVGLVDGALARVERVIAALAQRSKGQAKD